MKRKKKQLFFRRVIIFFVLVIIGCIIYLLNMNVPSQSYDQYQKEAKTKIIEYDLLDLINENEYSKTLEMVLINNNYDKQYFKDYLLINYQDNKDFAKNINIFLQKGHSVETINNIYESYSDKIISFLVNNETIVNLDYLKIDNFVMGNYLRYEEYRKKNNMSLSQIVTYVNIGLDNSYYSKYDLIENPESITVLVNKYHKLDNDYVPKDLVKLYNGKLIKEIVKEPLMELIDAAKAYGIDLVPRSVYRSYSYQAENYNNYVRRDGKTIADTYSARPGFSEHQTGLVIDLASADNVFVKDNSKEYNWLKDNIHNYGFIIRYPLGKEPVTGYKFEPWHIRYVGQENAKKIYELKITYDEYYDMYLKENV